MSVAETKAPGGRPRHSIGTLGNRFEEAAQVIRESWSENHEQSSDYNPEFIASCYEYPGVDPALSPAIFENGKLAAFVSAFPRQVRLYGSSLRLALLTFFTVAKGMKGKGLGLAVWAECLRRAREAGYDGAIHWCVDGNPSNQITVAAARSIGLETVRVYTVNYVMRVIKERGAALPIADNAFREAFAQHAAAADGQVPLVRAWTRDEIAWECVERYGAICAAYDSNPARGLLTGYVLPIADRDHTPCLLFGNIFWGTLQSGERSELLEQFLRASNAQIVIAPIDGLTDMSPFTAARFRRSTRMLHTYLTLWCGAERPSALNSMYIDVL